MGRLKGREMLAGACTETCELDKRVEVVSLTQGPSHHFFGYFDKTPWNSETRASDRALCHQTSVWAHSPAPGEAAAVGYVTDGVFTEIGCTTTWNFQQGAMLQWLPGAKDRVAFNAVRSGSPHGIVLDLTSGEERAFTQPIAAISPDGLYALSLDFGRLYSVRPDYGYVPAATAHPGVPAPDDDGVWRIALRSGESRLIVSLAQLAEFERSRSEGEFHWVNHPLFNPTGSRLCFVHRYTNAAGTLTTRLLTCGIDGGGLRLLISGLASHATWYDDSNVLAWAGKRALVRQTSRGLIGHLPVGRALKWIYRLLGKPSALKSKLMNDRFIMFDDDANTARDFARGLFWCDGHSSFSPDRRWMVTDTYPDRKRWASVLLWEVGTDDALEVARFWAPPELEDEVRCDLHPRWSPDGTRICVDSAHTGTRQMYALDVSGLMSR